MTSVSNGVSRERSRAQLSERERVRENAALLKRRGSRCFSQQTEIKRAETPSHRLEKKGDRGEEKGKHICVYSCSPPPYSPHPYFPHFRLWAHSAVDTQCVFSFSLAQCVSLSSLLHLVFIPNLGYVSSRLIKTGWGPDRSVCPLATHSDRLGESTHVGSHSSSIIPALFSKVLPRRTQPPRSATRAGSLHFPGLISLKLKYAADQNPRQGSKPPLRHSGYYRATATYLTLFSPAAS